MHAPKGVPQRLQARRERGEGCLLQLSGHQAGRGLPLHVLLPFVDLPGRGRRRDRPVRGRLRRLAPRVEGAEDGVHIESELRPLFHEQVAVAILLIEADEPRQRLVPHRPRAVVQHRHLPLRAGLYHHAQVDVVDVEELLHEPEERHGADKGHLPALLHLLLLPRRQLLPRAAVRRDPGVRVDSVLGQAGQEAGARVRRGRQPDPPCERLLGLRHGRRTAASSTRRGHAAAERGEAGGGGQGLEGAPDLRPAGVEGGGGEGGEGR